MPKPKTIILVRHGESQGNVDRSIYTKIPDYAVKLTDNGKNQAFVAGQKIHELIGGEEAAFYISPFHRTRQTFQELAKTIPVNRLREDPRLREQEWRGQLHPETTHEERMAVEKQRDAYSTFYYRFNGGESCADVYDRVSSFLDTLHRDFQKEDFPPNCIIVTHGMTLRVFLMRWFSTMTVEDFELLGNPENCCRIVLTRVDKKFEILEDPELIKKGIISKIRKHDKPKHPYQMPL